MVRIGSNTQWRSCKELHAVVKRPEEEYTTMNSTTRRTVIVAVCLMALPCLTACTAMETRTQKGTAGGVAIGAAAGAGLGQAIGRNTAGTLWGAAIGAVVGGIAGHQIGNYMDQQEGQLQTVAAQSDAMSIARTRDVLTATFKGDVMFDFDSAAIKAGTLSQLDGVARVLNQYSETVIQVEGHTDASGSEEYNQKLSERRAEAVKNALVQRGVHQARIQAVGFGETMPISSSAAMNRRVNIVIVPVQAQG